jgi:spore coat protein A
MHDHTIGITRLSMYAGIMAFYLIDPIIATPLSVVDKKHDLFLALADRTFNTDGSLFYPEKWEPEFYG